MEVSLSSCDSLKDEKLDRQGRDRKQTTEIELPEVHIADLFELVIVVTFGEKKKIAGKKKGHGRSA